MSFDGIINHRGWQLDIINIPTVITPSILQQHLPMQMAPRLKVVHHNQLKMASNPEALRDKPVNSKQLLRLTTHSTMANKVKVKVKVTAKAKIKVKIASTISIINNTTHSILDTMQTLQLLIPPLAPTRLRLPPTLLVHLNPKLPQRPRRNKILI
jgi:hypothetical protein